MRRPVAITLGAAGLAAAGAALAVTIRSPRPHVPAVAVDQGRHRPPRVVIAGGGYVGFTAARALRRRLNTDEVEIAVVDPRPYMTYQPFLPEVAAGSIQPRHVVASHRRGLDGITILTGSVTGIDHANRNITITPPTPESTRVVPEPYQLAYDHLVLALGAEARTLPIPGLAEQALGFKQVEEALALRNRVLSNIEEAASTWDHDRRRRLLTFVFVGGGFAGVEAIAELEDMARAAVAKIPSVEQSDVHFVLVEGTRRILPELTEELSGYGLQQLRERDIDVRLSTFLNSCVDGHVVLSDGTEFDADTIVWTAGVKAAPVLADSDLPIEGRGRVTTLPTLQVARDGVVVDGAWAAGDCAAVPDLTSADPAATCAPTAQHAVRQAKVLADNLAATLAAGPDASVELTGYRHENLGTVASLGIGKGVARILGHNLRGLPAWTAHRGYHVYAMPTLNRKVRIMMDWFAAAVFRRDLASFGSVAAPGAAFAAAAEHDAQLAQQRARDGER
ncbi:NAD(P)/FAD-dependent oxidoreductase [Actinomyces succiniciruminis]|uniref:Pyridine nucleotide-disulfide oxidoreductase n=1 Tax=Actinomyces succiniciruminis TaxID=1522002 RepID=A0A1L7RKA9_9ACTO|nr:NAD(P)/FAD-dependent oxidoreductase [Actinomyces succiniciruminis]CED91499.1 Pyridine nucleotide-disulfide oxidoreductase [Actinomyces succiniciruminis]